MLENTSPQFVLRPKIHFKMGMVYLRLGEKAEAMKEFALMAPATQHVSEQGKSAERNTPNEISGK